MVIGNNKKGYLRTLEAVIAVVLLMIIVFSSLSFKEPKTKNIPPDIEIMQDRILSEVQSNGLLRNYLISNDVGGLESYLTDNIPQGGIGFSFDICFDVINDCEVRSNDLLQGGDVYVDSLIIYEDATAVIFRLYLWHDTF